MKLDSDLFAGIRISDQKKKKKAAKEAEAKARECQWEGCARPGAHKAPAGRDREGEYYQFCVDHVREYNKKYNYFSGLEDTEVAKVQKEALTGERPTKPFSSNPTGDKARASHNMSQLRSGRAGYYKRIQAKTAYAEPGAAPVRKLKPLEAKAMATLGLKAKDDENAIRQRYKELVKQHHPDANGGSRESEQRLAEVLKAYKVLRAAKLC